MGVLRELSPNQSYTTHPQVGHSPSEVCPYVAATIESLTSRLLKSRILQLHDDSTLKPSRKVWNIFKVWKILEKLDTSQKNSWRSW